MAQPTIASYFNTRKRTAIEDLKLGRARKVLNLTDDDGHLKAKQATLNDVSEKLKEKTISLEINDLKARVVVLKNEAKTKTANPRKVATRTTKSKKSKEVANSQDLQKMFESIKSENKEPVQSIVETVKDLTEELHRTPPSTPTKINAMDKVIMTGQEMNFREIKQKLSRSNRLAELKASIARYKEKETKLKQLEASRPKSSVESSPNLKVFKSLELEVHLSPQKCVSPQKAYLSPRKDSSARRNLLNQLTPTKNAVAVPPSPNKALTSEKTGLTLPFKYRTLAELFRSVDTVCQILFNRKETITFKKLKPVVEELLKRNLTEKHLGQIQHLYKEAFIFRQEKLRAYGTKHETWELIVDPNCKDEAITSEFLLTRRRKFFKTLIDKVHVYHREFLLSLDPPIEILPENITRWHAAFDIERVPDIEAETLPQPPYEEKFTTGKDVLAKAKSMFNCNTRMERALERLKEAQERKEVSEDVPKQEAAPQSVLKGIPKALLEKVRQKQAAKALESMTRSDEKDKEVQLYSHLPELARLTRNLFVAEKKSVLPIETVLVKLTDSIRSFMTRDELETRLKHLAKEVPEWIVFHNIRNGVFVKIQKSADLSVVLDKLDKLLKEKTAT